MLSHSQHKALEFIEERPLPLVQPRLEYFVITQRLMIRLCIEFGQISHMCLVIDPSLNTSPRWVFSINITLYPLLFSSSNRRHIYAISTMADTFRSRATDTKKHIADTNDPSELVQTHQLVERHLHYRYSDLWLHPGPLGSPAAQDRHLGCNLLLFHRTEYHRWYIRSTPSSKSIEADHVAGYHRLWAHSSYPATLPLRIWLVLMGAGAIEGSVRWWARDHRAHHRYTDTDKDPYSIRKGLLYSHLSWMVMKQNPKRIGRTDISDLNGDAVVVWQHRNYIKLVFVMGLVVPMFVAGLGWGDWWGGFVYGGILHIFFVQQATFCVNSLAHWLGDQPFDDRKSPRDHVLTALITFGEGYHNFHHEFPSDYRCSLTSL